MTSPISPVPAHRPNIGAVPPHDPLVEAGKVEQFSRASGAMSFFGSSLQTVQNTLKNYVWNPLSGHPKKSDQEPAEKEQEESQGELEADERAPVNSSISHPDHFISKENQLVSTPTKTKLVETSEHVNGLGSFLLNSVKEGSYKLIGSASSIAKGARTGLSSRVVAGLQMINYDNAADKEMFIEKTYDRMRNAVNDPHFVDLAKFAGEVLKKLDVSGFPKVLQKYLHHVLEVNIPNGFANLADLLNENRAKIPNYQNQSPLVNTIALLNQRLEAHPQLKNLAEYEKPYSNVLLLKSTLLKNMLPSLSSDPETQKVFETYIRHLKAAGPLSKDARDDLLMNEEFNAAEAILFPKIDSAELPADQYDRFVENLSGLLIHEEKHSAKLNEIFASLTDEIVTLFFPKRIDDIDVPYLNTLKMIPSLKKYIYDLICGLVSDLIRSNYKSLIINEAQKGVWEKTINDQMPGVNIPEIAKKSGTLVTTIGKYLIQSSPGTVALVDNKLYELTRPLDASMPAGEIQAPSEGTKTEEVISKLSQEGLAAWIVKSAQQLLHTSDPKLLKTGEYVGKLLENLSMASLAKGLDALMLPQAFGPGVSSTDQFFKMLIDQIVSKIRSMKEPAEAQHFEKWVKFADDFLLDLPLPDVLKAVVKENVVDQLKSLRDQVNEVTPVITKVTRLLDDSIADIKTYRGGDELITVSENLTDMLLKFVLKEGTVWSFSETFIEELLENNFPRIKLDLQTKDWLKANLSQLGQAENSSLGLQYLKKMIHSLILKTIDQSIKNSVNPNSETDYSLQFLNKINSIFINSFDGLTDLEQQNLMEAHKIQLTVDQLTTRQAKLKAFVAAKPASLKDEELADVNQILMGVREEINLQNTIQNLSMKEEKLLDEINREWELGDKIWSLSDLKAIQSALAYRQEHRNEIEVIRGRDKCSEMVAFQKMRLEILEPFKGSEAKEVADIEMMVKLFEFGSDKLKLFSELLQVKSTLDHSRQEALILSEESRKRMGAMSFSTHSTHVMNGRHWVDLAVEALKELNRLPDAIESQAAQLDAHLISFRMISKELSKLLGLDKANLTFLNEKGVTKEFKDKVETNLDLANEKMIPRLLFKQFFPLLKLKLDHQANRATLQQGVNGAFWLNLARHSSKAIVTKIPEIVNVEEVDKLLDASVVGISGLRKILAAELQALVSKNNPTVLANKEFIEKYIEEFLVNYFVKISKQNQEVDILSYLENKITSFTVIPAVPFVPLANSVAHPFIDEMLKDLMHLSSLEDLTDVPPALREMAYEQLKAQAYNQLSPMIMPLIERRANLHRLDEVSGSKMLGSMCAALSKDLFTLLPSVIESHHEISLQIFQDLEGRPPVGDEAVKMEAGVRKLYENSKNSTVTHKAILEVFVNATGQVLDFETRKAKMQILKDKKAKETVSGVIKSPEEIAALIAKAVPQLDVDFQKELASGIRSLIHGRKLNYENISSIAGTYLEAMLLRLFVGIAEKNRKIVKDGVVVKDSAIVISEKLLSCVTTQYLKAKEAKSFSNFSKDLNDDIMVNVLNIAIDSDQSLVGLPVPAQKSVHDLIKNQIGNYVKSIKEKLTLVDDTHPDVMKLKENLKRFGENEAQKAYAVVAAEDIGKMLSEMIPFTLGKVTGKNLSSGTNAISKGMESTFEDFAKGNLEIAKLFLAYPRKKDMVGVLDKTLKHISSPDLHKDEKEVVAGILGNVFLQPMNQLLQRVEAFEQQQGEAFNQKLMANFIEVAAAHIETRHQAQSGSDFTHEGFVRAAGKNLHPATQSGENEYAKSMAEISRRLDIELTDTEKVKKIKIILSQMVEKENIGAGNLSINTLIHALKADAAFNIPLRSLKRLKAIEGPSLKDMIRADGAAQQKIKEETFYLPAAKSLMDMMFPNGKADMNYLPEELRDVAWKQLRTNVFPMVMQNIVESIFEKKTMTNIILSGLESTRDILNEDSGNVDLGVAVETNPALAAAGGKLLNALLKDLQLPTIVMKQIIDPQTGQVTAKVANALGNTLTSTFNKTFIKDKILSKALSAAAGRDPITKAPFLNADLRANEIKAAQDPAEIKEMEEKITKVSREVVDALVTSSLRGNYEKNKALYIRGMGKVFGKEGVKFANLFIDIFEFIFFKVWMSLLTWVFAPLKQRAKEIIYNSINLDANMDFFVKFLRDQPDGQPGNKKHPIYHEDLIYKLGHVLRMTVEETLGANPASS